MEYWRLFFAAKNNFTWFLEGLLLWLLGQLRTSTLIEITALDLNVRGNVYGTHL